MTCSRCHKPRDRKGQRYCLKCHALSMRTWRKTHPLTPEQRVKDNARSYANTYERRGLLRRKPCKVCGDGKSEKHHPDYSRPLYVIWLCRTHHLELHAKERKRAKTKKRSKPFHRNRLESFQHELRLETPEPA